jgi:hypothetical protein
LATERAIAALAQPPAGEAAAVKKPPSPQQKPQPAPPSSPPPTGNSQVPAQRQASPAHLLSPPCPTSSNAEPGSPGGRAVHPQPAAQRRPAATKVDSPRRLQGRKGFSKEGIFIAGARWGCPFRTRTQHGRWFTVWAGDRLGLADHRPPGWQDIACADRREAAALCQAAFEEWLTHPAQAECLERVRRELAGYNLICVCPPDHPFCHGSLLLKLANEATKAAT